MYAALYLLTVSGLVGSFDVLYYHMYKLRLFSRNEAMWENLTHAIRALLYATLMLTVLHVHATGWCWLVYPVLLGCEVVNTMADTILEPRSRKSTGGLPPVEYSLHVFLSIVTGAALASIVWGTHDLLFQTPSLSWRTLDIPLQVLLGSYSSVLIALGMFVFESVGFFRLLRRRLS
jgi:hypothetical protein